MQHPFAQKWSIRYLLSYISVTRGDFDSKHRCPQPASFPNRPRTGRKQDRSFLSFARGQHPSSRSSAPSYLNLPKSPFQTYQVSFRFRSLSNSFGTRSKTDPVSQDLSGFFTSIPTERFHQALQVLLHRYDQVVGLRRSSQWSVYELKSDHRRRMLKGKWRRQTKVPRTFREQDLRCLRDFVIDSSHFEINGYLFRQERGVAMGSPAAPPLCNLVATVEDFFSHQTMCSLRFRMPDVGVIWHERYVDNRFILLRDSAPQSPVLRNFLSLEFYRPPVMLEFQNDDKVLGYLCDSSSRTVTLPDHPLKSIGSGVPMIRCSLTLRGLPARGSSYVVLNLRFSNNLDLTLSNAFMKPKVSIRISFVMFGDDS